MVANLCYLKIDLSWTCPQTCPTTKIKCIVIQKRLKQKNGAQKRRRTSIYLIFVVNVGASKFLMCFVTKIEKLGLKNARVFSSSTTYLENQKDVKSKRRNTSAKKQKNSFGRLVVRYSNNNSSPSICRSISQLDFFRLLFI